MLTEAFTWLKLTIKKNGSVLPIIGTYIKYASYITPVLRRQQAPLLILLEYNIAPILTLQ